MLQVHEGEGPFDIGIALPTKNMDRNEPHTARQPHHLQKQDCNEENADN